MAPEPCIFCSLPRERIVAENELAVAIRDAFPVGPGHTLLVTKRHVSSWFDTTDEERLALFKLADQVRQELDIGPPFEAPPQAERSRANDKPRAYNLGVNVGEAAGQTVMHVHLHLIPRFAGDVEDPTGGVRLVIPDKGNYRG